MLTMPWCLNLEKSPFFFHWFKWHFMTLNVYNAFWSNNWIVKESLGASSIQEPAWLASWLARRSSEPGHALRTNGKGEGISNCCYTNKISAMGEWGIQLTKMPMIQSQNQCLCYTPKLLINTLPTHERC